MRQFFKFIYVVVRGQKARREYEVLIQKHRAAVTIQRKIKKTIARKNMKSIHDASVVIQSGIFIIAPVLHSFL